MTLKLDLPLFTLILAITLLIMVLHFNTKQRSFSGQKANFITCKTFQYMEGMAPRYNHHHVNMVTLGAL